MVTWLYYGTPSHHPYFHGILHSKIINILHLHITNSQALDTMKLLLLILQLTLALTAKYRSVSLVPEPTALAASNKSQAEQYEDDSWDFG